MASKNVNCLQGFGLVFSKTMEETDVKKCPKSKYFTYIRNIKIKQNIKGYIYFLEYDIKNIYFKDITFYELIEKVFT